MDCFARYLQFQEAKDQQSGEILLQVIIFCWPSGPGMLKDGGMPQNLLTISPMEIANANFKVKYLTEILNILHKIYHHIYLLKKNLLVFTEFESCLLGKLFHFEKYSRKKNCFGLTYSLNFYEIMAHV